MNLLMLVRQLPEEVDSVLLFGHNPALTALVNHLSDFSLDNLPTAGVVAIGFDTSWVDITTKSGRKLFFEYPKKQQG
jgi:phosphohistidine phosphatase